MEKLKKRIVFLWIFIMLGFTLHNVADIMPIFWGVDVAIDASGAAPQGLLLFMMVLSFLLPGAGCLCMLYADGRWALWVNLVLAVVVMLFNFVHSIELTHADNWGQFAILPLMDVLGILLTIDTVKAFKTKENA